MLKLICDLILYSYTACPANCATCTVKDDVSSDFTIECDSCLENYGMNDDKECKCKLWMETKTKEHFISDK